MDLVSVNINVKRAIIAYYRFPIYFSGLILRGTVGSQQQVSQASPLYIAPAD